MEEAWKLKKKDPAGFERILQDAGRRFEEAWEAEKATLREKAKSDAAAARILRGRLKTDLKGLLDQQKSLTRALETDPLARDAIHNVERQIRAIEGELASVESTLPLLTSRT